MTLGSVSTRGGGGEFQKHKGRLAVADQLIEQATARLTQ